MASSRIAYAIHLAVISIASAITYLAIIVQIRKNRKTSKTDLLFTALGLSNFSISVFTIFRSLVFSLLNFNDTKTSLFDAVFFGLYATHSDLNLSLNVAIEYNRLCAAGQRKKYSQDKERSKLQRRLIVVTVVGSLALGMANGLALGFVRIRLLRNWIEAVSRFIT